MAVAQRHPAVLPPITGSSPVAAESIFYTPSPSPTFIPRRPGSYLEPSPIIPLHSAFTPISSRNASLIQDVGKQILINNNFASKLTDDGVGPPGAGGLTPVQHPESPWMPNRSAVAVTPSLSLPYSPFVISTHSQNIYPFVQNNSLVAPPNQILLFNPNGPYGSASGTQCIFK